MHKKPYYSMCNRAWLLVGGPHAGRWVLLERQQKLTGKILRFVR